MSVIAALDETSGLQSTESDAQLGFGSANADEKSVEVHGGSTTLEAQHGAEDGEFGVHAKTLSFGLNGCPVNRVDFS